MKFGQIATLLFFGLCVLTPALAAKPAKTQIEIDKKNFADALRNAENAKEKFQAGEYDTALALFEAAYAIIRSQSGARRDILLFNMARCLEELHRYEAALKKLEECLLVTGTDEAARAEVHKRIAKITALLHPSPAIAIPITVPAPAPIAPPSGQTAVSVDAAPLPTPNPKQTRGHSATWQTTHVLSVIGASTFVALGVAAAYVATNKYTESEEIFVRIKSQEDANSYYAKIDEYRVWRNARNGFFIIGSVGALVAGYFTWQHVYVVPSQSGAAIGATF